MDAVQFKKQLHELFKEVMDCSIINDKVQIISWEDFDNKLEKLYKEIYEEGESDARHHYKLYKDYYNGGL